MQCFALFFGLFGLSLISFPAGILGFLSLPFLIFSQQTINLKVFGILSCFLLVLAVSLAFPGDYQLEAAYKIYFVTCIGLFIVPFVINHDHKVLLKVIRWVLVAHAMVWVLQALLHYGAGFQLDFVAMFYETGSRNNYFGSSIVRFSGLYEEPGTYGNVVGLLAVLYFYLCRRFDGCLLLVVLTLAASLSVYAYVYISLIALGFLLSLKLSFRTLLALLVIGGLIVSFVAFMLLDRFSAGDGGILVKLQPVLFWLGQDIERQVWGVGLLGNDCGCLIADSTLLFHLLFVGGVPFVIAFVVLVRPKRVMHLPLFFGLLVTKLSYWEPVLWVVVMAYVFVGLSKAERV